MIDFETEKVFLLADAHKHHRDFPKNYGTIWGWAFQGIAALDGTRVKLEVVKKPQGWSTSYEAYVRFIAAINRDPHAAAAARGAP
jgi:hypothetical protein